MTKRQDRDGTGEVRCTDVWLENDSGYSINSIMIGEPLTICIGYSMLKTKLPCIFNIGLRGNTDISLSHLSSSYTNFNFVPKEKNGVVKCRIETLPLNVGHYRVNICIANPNSNAPYDRLQGVVIFHVESSDFFGTGKLPPPGGGLILLACKWSASP